MIYSWWPFKAPSPGYIQPQLSRATFPCFFFPPYPDRPPSVVTPSIHPEVAPAESFFLQAALHSWTGFRVLVYWLYLLAFEWLLSCVSRCHLSCGRKVCFERNDVCSFPILTFHGTLLSVWIDISFTHKRFLSISNGFFTHLLWAGCVHLPPLPTALPVYSTSFDGQYLTQCPVVWQ